jgi:hypothetical protein
MVLDDQGHGPSSIPRGRAPVSILEEAGEPHGRTRQVRRWEKFLARDGIHTPGGPTCRTHWEKEKTNSESVVGNKRPGLW